MVLEIGNLAFWKIFPNFNLNALFKFQLKRKFQKKKSTPEIYGVGTGAGFWAGAEFEFGAEFGSIAWAFFFLMITTTLTATTPTTTTHAMTIPAIAPPVKTFLNASPKSSTFLIVPVYSILGFKRQILKGV